MDEEILYLCCRIHNVCCNCHPSWCHICHTTSQSIQLQPRQCTLDHCTTCHSISICYQNKVLSTWRTQYQAHRMGRLGLGCLHGHSLLNVWLCFQPWLRPGFLELQKAANCCNIQHQGRIHC